MVSDSVEGFFFELNLKRKKPEGKPSRVDNSIRKMMETSSRNITRDLDVWYRKKCHRRGSTSFELERRGKTRFL